MIIVESLICLVVESKRHEFAKINREITNC